MTAARASALKMELRGIEPIPDDERRGRPLGLFWLWFASGIGILGVTYGLILVTAMGLNFVQVFVAVVLGAGLSGALVGALSIAGVRGGAPGLTLSRAVFGHRGNLGPTLLSWLGFVGWETVMCTTASFALLQILEIAGIPSSPVATVICVLLVVAIAAAIGFFGHATILFLQKWLTWIFGGFTVVVIAFLLPSVQWDLVSAQPAAPAATVVGAVGFIAAGTGLGWLSAGADYARYLPRTTKGIRVVLSTALGGVIPLTALVALGGLLAVGEPTLVNADDPVAAIGAALPSWLIVPYLLTAVVGLMTGADLSMYSSGLNLVSAGVPVRRTTAVAIDAALITGGGLYITLITEDFFGTFTAFLTLLAIPLAAWAAVFGIDMIGRKNYDAASLMTANATSSYWYTRGIRWPAVIAWVAGIVVGIGLATMTIAGETVYAGPLSGTWLGQNNLAWLGGGLCSFGIFGSYALAVRLRPRIPAALDGVGTLSAGDAALPSGVVAGARDRARGALVGLAIGDALGMPTQYLPRELIQARYGLINDFIAGPDDNDLSRGVPAGHVTDDTDQAVILGELIVEGRGSVDLLEFSRRLIAWESRMRASGSLDLLGPSTLKALKLFSEGASPDETGRWGDTNGAAMRIAPVGIAIPATPLHVLVDATERANRVTHNTGVAISGAAAVAAAVSSGIAGARFRSSVEIAIEAARLGHLRGGFVAGADVALRIRWAVDLVADEPTEKALDLIYRLVGVGVATQEAVPAAFAIASLFPTNTWEACRHAASLGGDCDTIAAMAGAIVGAHVGVESVPHHILRTLETANPELHLVPLADSLFDIRIGR